MLFFPYRVDIDLKRLPFITILISILCIFIYYQQSVSERAINNSASEYCQKKQSRIFLLVVKKVTQSDDSQACIAILQSLQNNSNPQNTINKLVDYASAFDSMSLIRSRELMVGTLNKVYNDFKQQAPKSLTAKLMYDPATLSIDKMITSVFAHGSWLHLIGNLFFFYAFAASVEIILGSFSFLVVIIGVAIGTNLAYTVVALADPYVLPTLGLSGVVMGMIGLFIFLIPLARIRCFFWFILIVRVFSVPAWMLALWYIGWDVYNLYTGDNDSSNVNLVAHVSGAAIGVITGLIFFRNRRPTITVTKRLRGIP